MQILIAEDSAMMRRLIEATLGRAGHQVTVAPDGLAAWACYEAHRPDMVLLDWQMPGLDGLEVCRRIRSAPGGEDVFVLMVTARDGSDDLSSALDAGADDYLLKPFTNDHLLARLTIAARRLELNAARRHAEQSLAHARWLAGIGETALALQHEINNPLFALLAEAQLLSEDGHLPQDQRARIAALADQARRIAAVVKHLASLEEPTTVEYLGEARMLDLSGSGPAVT